MQMVRGGSWLEEDGGGDYGVFGLKTWMFASHQRLPAISPTPNIIIVLVPHCRSFAQFAQTGTVLQFKICTILTYFGAVTYICTAEILFTRFAISKENTIIILRASAEQQEAFAIKRDATLEEPMISNPFFLFLNS